MNTKIIIATLLTASTLIGGCATTASKIAADEAKAAQIRIDAEEKKRAEAQKRMEEQVSEVPAWALEQPRPDATGIYSVGISSGTKLDMAIKKAHLQAEFGLAKAINQELSGSERSYGQDNGVSGVTEQYTQLIDKLVDAVPVVGFEIVKQEVKPINGEYHAFVLMKLPYEEFNKVLASQRQSAKNNEIKAAFDELESRLEKRRAQRQAKAEQPAPSTGKKES